MDENGTLDTNPPGTWGLPEKPRVSRREWYPESPSGPHSKSETLTSGSFVLYKGLWVIHVVWMRLTPVTLLRV